MTTEILDKVVKFFKDMTRRFPLLFVKNSQKIFWFGMVIVLIAGTLIFYFKAHLPINREYEVFVVTRRVNQELLDQIFQYIMEQRDAGGPIPTENPFEP